VHKTRGMKGKMEMERSRRVSRVGSRGEGLRGLVRRKIAKRCINSRGMH
jgi:hypothetical protein